MKKLFAVTFMDGRERRHVAAMRAATPQEAIQMAVKYAEDREGLYWHPDLTDVVEIEPDANEEGVQVLWHQAYD